RRAAPTYTLNCEEPEMLRAAAILQSTPNGIQAAVQGGRMLHPDAGRPPRSHRHHQLQLRVGSRH
ncbi:hypothetical protein, partial [Psychromicrobium xiongbiense]|uniref:hypothetical protein n=1 Tax=Psychromicrobium xiongbiense TaxID=3051184 RepID=UPI00255504C5